MGKKEKLIIAITGSITNPEPKFNPYTYCNSPAGKELLWRLCQEPVSLKEVDDDLREGLELIEAIRVEKGKCYLNFPCFLKKDKEIILQVSEKYTRELVESIKNKKSEFYEMMENLRYKEAGAKKHLFFLVGCACLDWKGLILLRETGQIVEKTRAGNNKYTLFGNEKEQDSLKELYWGSHNQTCGQYVFTSFGDHEHGRYSFPDIFFWLSHHGLEKFKETTFHKELHISYNKGLEEWGRLLFKAITTGELSEHIQLLERLKYLKAGSLNVPVIVEEDRVAIEPLSAIMSELILEWAHDYYGKFAGELKETTPLKFGVDFQEVFIQIWHYIFAVTNKNLARSGFFFDPYGEDSDWQGYLPVIHSAELEMLWK